jgi:hypothetical protein
MSPARDRDWNRLSASSRRRWTAALGGRGTPERRAERARAAYEGGAHLTPEQRGHEPAEVRAGRTISALFGDDASYREVSHLNRAETARLARYNGLVGQLAQGQISPAEFERRVRSWRPVAGERLASNPEAVLARLEQRRAEDAELVYYVSGRTAA